MIIIIKDDYNIRVLEAILVNFHVGTGEPQAPSDYPYLEKPFTVMFSPAVFVKDSATAFHRVPREVGERFRAYAADLIRRCRRHRQVWFGTDQITIETWQWVRWNVS